MLELLIKSWRQPFYQVASQWWKASLWGFGTGRLVQSCTVCSLWKFSLWNRNSHCTEQASVCVVPSPNRIMSWELSNKSLKKPFRNYETITFLELVWSVVYFVMFRLLILAFKKKLSIKDNFTGSCLIVRCNNDSPTTSRIGTGSASVPGSLRPPGFTATTRTRSKSPAFRFLMQYRLAAVSSSLATTQSVAVGKPRICVSERLLGSLFHIVKRTQTIRFFSWWFLFIVIFLNVKKPSIKLKWFITCRHQFTNNLPIRSILWLPWWNLRRHAVIWANERF